MPQRPARSGWLPLLPLLVLLLPFMAGVALTALQSVGLATPALAPAPSGPLQLSWDGWRELTSPVMQDALLLGVRVALLSALGAVAAGTLLALGIWRLPLHWQRLGLLGRIPLIMPHIAVGWLVILFCTRSGLLSAVALHMGIIERQAQFPALLYGGDGTGMMLAYLWKETPFVMLLVAASLHRLDTRLLDTAHMLGAGRWQTFRSVVLPHVAPVLHTCFLILFLYALGAVEIPFLLGESTPAMPGMEAYTRYFHADLADRAPAMALMTLLFATGIAVVAIYVRVVAHLSGRERVL